ncbi:MAG: hypothetical protein ABI838_00840 [Chloroflexota bacterium]
MTAAAVTLHAFGPRYDLPLSLALYLYAAAGVVVISFVMVTVLAVDRLAERATRYPTWPAPWLETLDRWSWSRRIGGLVGLALLGTVIGTGLLGSQNPFFSVTEYLVWIYLWAGLVILTGLVGNPWEYLNPFAALDRLVRRFYNPPPRPLPERLGVWAAIVLYYAFVFLELASGVANQPRLIGLLALLYTLFTLAGTLTFGREVWLHRVEFLTVLFDLVSRFSPIERTERGGLAFRPWGAGLLRPYPVGWDRVVFVILTLSSLAFDGLIATAQWQSLSTALEPWWTPLGQLGFVLVRGLGIIAVTVVFLAVFSVIAQLVIYFGYAKVDVPATVSVFVLTLVPIALVYNAAHNYSYLVVNSQNLVPLIPGLSGYQVNYVLANAAVVWYLQVVLIVIGHVIAVYLAHLRAGERFKTAKNALLSQYPMLILMVAYTMTSLWILAQPTTRGG